jgi:hypothetical protein
MMYTLVPTLTTNHVSSVPMTLREKRSDLQIFSVFILPIVLYLMNLIQHG